MIYLNPRELIQLKSFFSELSPKKGASAFPRKTLSLNDKLKTITMLRSKLPDLFSDLTEENLKDNLFLIKYLSNPHNIIKIKNALKDNLVPKQQAELIQSLEKPYIEEASIQSAGQEISSAPEMTPISGAPSSGIPSMPTFSTPAPAMARPRIIHNVPQAEPESKAYSRPIETPPKEILIANKDYKVTGKISKETAPSVKEARTVSSAPTVSEPPPKLVIADRYGNIAKEPLKNQETAKLFTQDKNNIIREHTVKTPSRFSGFKSSLNNFGSKAGVIFQRNIGKHLTGDRAMNFLGKAGNTSINALSGISNLGERPGGVFSHIGGFGRNGGKRGFFGRFGKGGGQQGSLVGKTKGRGGLIFAAGLIGSMVLVGGMTAFAPNPTPGEAAPLPINNFGLDYTLPLKNASVQPADIKAQVKAAFPGAKLEYWDKILQSSLAAGFNPALALALWIEETGASHTTLSRNGGSEIPVNGSFTKGHLGCAPTEDQTINESLSCLFKFVAANNFTNDQFAQFMSKYSGGPAEAPFSNNPNFTTNLRAWYSRLVPTGPGALVAVTPTPKPPITAVASCPVPEGRISTPSYNANPKTGHCGDSYNYKCHCGTTGRRAKAIDVPTKGQSALLPKIDNQPTTWRLMVGPYSVDGGEGGGFGYTFQTSQGSDTWYLDMLHLNQSSLVLGGEYPSGTPVSTSVITHVHITIGKNLKQTPVAGTETDCDPNWLPSDFLCQ